MYILYQFDQIYVSEVYVDRTATQTCLAVPKIYNLALDVSVLIIASDTILR